jgi:hypothetical protein
MKCFRPVNTNSQHLAIPSLPDCFPFTADRGRHCAVLMNQSSRDDTLLGLRPSPEPGRGAVSTKSSRDKLSKHSLPGIHRAKRRYPHQLSTPVAPGGQPIPFPFLQSADPGKQRHVPSAPAAFQLAPNPYRPDEQAKHDRC